MANTLALVSQLKEQLPELWGEAQIVGKWVWLEFNVPPMKEVRDKLKQLGFHWNSMRRCWQHPCGASRGRSQNDPKSRYPMVPATALQLQESALPPRTSARHPKEFKIVALRECPLPEQMQICDTPERAADYWNLHVKTNPYFNPECECFTILLLNTRRRVKGHQLVSIGTMDSLLVHPREVFRVAVIAASAAVILMHNHPSGEPTPSDSDIKVTRDLIRAGQVMRIDVLDHVIVGANRYVSLRELGYFYS
jgi:hypothetical protein